MLPCKSTAEEVSFEWSHHRISSTDSKVKTTLHVSITDSRSERVNYIISVVIRTFLLEFFFQFNMQIMTSIEERLRYNCSAVSVAWHKNVSWLLSNGYLTSDESFF